MLVTLVGKRKRIHDEPGKLHERCNVDDATEKKVADYSPVQVQSLIDQGWKRCKYCLDVDGGVETPVN